MLFLIFITGTCIADIAKSHTEFVSLHDLNSDHDRRNLDAGLSSYLEFNLKRDEGNIKLKLTENTRLSRTLPVYDGFQMDTVSIENVRFYQDFDNVGSFAVHCEIHSHGPCRRTLTGNLFIGNRNFDILPATDIDHKRDLDLEDDGGTPHLLVENDLSKFGGSVRDYVRREPEAYPKDVNIRIHDYVDARELAHDQISENEHHLMEDLKDLLGKEQDRIFKSDTKTTFWIEVWVFLDAALWTRYNKTTTASANRTHDDEVTYQLLKHACEIINGVDIRYQLIEDPDYKFSVILRGMAISKEFVYAYEFGQDGTVYVDGEELLDSFSKALPSLTSPKVQIYDHAMLLTGADAFLIDNGFQYDSLLGIANIGGICHATGKASVSEDRGSFFQTISTAAHELGHNLGAKHDGHASARPCPEESMYIMTANDMPLTEATKYSLNPYRFSQCSVTAFKTTINALSSNCLTNEGQVFNQTLWDANKKHPGEVYDHDAQCKLRFGASSEKCGVNFETMPKGSAWINARIHQWYISPKPYIAVKNEDSICLIMKCTKPSGACANYMKAAMGTLCGTDKWCMDGECISKNPQVYGPGECRDVGFGAHTCRELNATYKTLEEFCRNWKSYCCRFCSNKGVTYRLVNGPSASSGRLEVHKDGIWGTVCDDNFESNAANVACRSMGYESGTQASHAKYGAGEGQIWMDDVKCLGDEKALGYCLFSDWGKYSSNCDHKEDVSLDCVVKAEDVCEDIGYGTYSCDKLITYARFITAKATVLEVCNLSPPLWKKYCCKSCKDAGSLAVSATP